MKHIKVWDIQTRVFHWSLALLTICCLVIADIPGYLGINAIPIYSDMWLGFHISVGTAIVLMILFRIFWGFTGPFYSKFKSFHFGIPQLWKYLKEIFRKNKTVYPGHNPAASWFTLAAITLTMLVFLTGLIVYGVDESRGILKFLHKDYFQYTTALKLSHFISAALLLAVIILHMSGVFLESFLHKTGTAKSMFTGKKYSKKTAPVIKIKTVFSILSFIMLLLPLSAGVYVYALIKTYEPEKIAVSELYKTECASCHMAYAPNMLPENSWKKMMAGLDDHFGDDASIDEKSKNEIQKYLVRNSAEKSMEEFSLKFMASADKTQLPLSTTKIGYWKKKHDKISHDVFKHESVKSKSNCIACHKWAEYGSFEDNDIKLPEKAVYAKKIDKKDNISVKSGLLADKNFKDNRL